MTCGCVKNVCVQSLLYHRLNRYVLTHVHELKDVIVGTCTNVQRHVDAELTCPLHVRITWQAQADWNYIVLIINVTADCRH